MKRLVVGAVLLALAAAAFGDDALQLPKGVLRTHFTGAYAFYSQEFDPDGQRINPTGFDSLSAINLGGAAELGVIDWLSAAVQWDPGLNIWSATNNGTPPYDRLVANGLYAVFVAAKMQVIGPQAPIASEKIRLAAAPGVKIPMSVPDWERQYEYQTSGTTDFIAESLDKSVMGFGLRAYFDYAPSKRFFLNLYSQFIYYPQAETSEIVSLQEWTASHILAEPTYEVKFGYDFTLEMEPHFETAFSNGMSLGAGCPVTYTLSPAVVRGGTADPDGSSYMLSVSPNLSLFLTQLFIPTEFKIGYTLPLLGQNTKAANMLALQIKTYFRLYR